MGAEVRRGLDWMGPPALRPPACLGWSHLIRDGIPGNDSDPRKMHPLTFAAETETC